MHPQDGRLTQRLTRSSGLGKWRWRELSWPSGQVPFSPQSFLCKRLSDLTKYELNQISCFNPVLHLPPLSISLFFSERQSQPFLYVWHVDGFHIQNQQLTCMLLYAKSYICLSFFLITPHFFWYCLIDTCEYYGTQADLAWPASAMMWLVRARAAASGRLRAWVKTE